MAFIAVHNKPSFSSRFFAQFLPLLFALVLLPLSAQAVEVEFAGVGLAARGVSLFLLVLAQFAFSLWLRRRDEAAYLLYALAAVALIARSLNDNTGSPVNASVSPWLAWLALAGMTAALAAFVHRACPLAKGPWRRQALGRGLLLASLGLSLLTLPSWWMSNAFLPHQLQQGFVVLLEAAALLLVIRAAYKRLQGPSRRELWPLAIGLLLSLIVGLHDFGSSAGWMAAPQPDLLPLTSLTIAAGLLYVVHRRHVRALDAAEAANRELGERLAAQALDLRDQHGKLGEVEREKALLSERQRLMQDMHDGLGSSLLSAMVAVEHGSMDREAVVDVLRECVDDLRLVIDSLEPVGHDLIALLATMRYRLGKRLQASGLVLDWDVQDLPMLDWLEPPDALHVLRLMQEALSNVLKHAKATRVRLVMRHLGRYVEIRVEDDGHGFELETAHRGRGLKSQQRRAEMLGGSVHLETAPGQGTRLILRLPVVRRTKPNPNPAR